MPPDLVTGDGGPFDEIPTLVASDFTAAEARVQHMVRVEPDSFDAHFMLGFIHSRRQDYGAAAAVVDAVNRRRLTTIVERVLESPNQNLGLAAKKCGFTALFSRRPDCISAA